MKSISCKCITYGRVDTLEEALYSFLIQEYQGDSELVIVNDYPLQKLHFDHPRVKIFNLDFTFDTIGDKENFAVQNCAYDTIAVWDDDDIAMPNHLNNIDKYFTDEMDLLQWHRGVFFNSKQITSICGLGNSGIVYSKKIWKQLGGHARENAGYDMTFVMKIKSMSRNVIAADPPDNEVSWFYYWANRSYHMSGAGTDTNDRPNVIQRHSEHIERLRQENKIPTGDVYLNPKWSIDYKQLLKDYNDKRIYS
jgi:hypothetical protein